MSAPLGAGQMPLCAAGEQQEVVHAVVIGNQLVVAELHCDDTAPLHRHGETTHVFWCLY